MCFQKKVATPAELANEPDQTRLQAAKESITTVIDSVNPDDAAEPLGYQGLGLCGW